MADSRDDNKPGFEDEDGTPPEAVVGGSGWNPIATAAVVGGALAATAGAYLGTRAMARRNGAKDGKVNSVMATAMTACDVAQEKRATPSAAEIVVAPTIKV